MPDLAARSILALSPNVSTPVLPWHDPSRPAAGHTRRMGLFDRFRRSSRTKMRAPARDATRTGSTRVRASNAADETHLQDFVVNRRGVEGFVEPRTAVSDVTLLLVAHDGEWTRRRVPSVDWAHKFCNNHQVPSYDAAVVGVPQRMRDYNRRKKQQGLDYRRP